MKLISLIFWLFCAIFQVFSQSYDYENLLITYDKVIGVQNTGLYQGIIYEEPFRIGREDTQFFLNNKFFSGSVLYDGQNYYGVELKYDVFNDDVLVKIISTEGGGTLKLAQEYLQSFTIDSKEFIKILPSTESNITRYGFHEEIYSGTQLKLYIKYIKDKIHLKNRDVVIHRFFETKNEHVLFLKNRYHRINNKKELISLFPNFKNEIKAFYSNNRKLRNRNRDDFKVALVKRLDLLFVKSNKMEDI